jgi:polynucleotide 5'-hydroxyl-kinase GRC3/NOL9
LLDTDPGQPIFSPPSLLSLHVLASPILTSASFANIRVPDKAHFLGSVNLRSCSERWTECVEDLVREWRESWSFTAEFEGLSSRSNGDEGEDRIKGIVPLVINTPGWTKGYGSLLLRQFTHISEPGCIFVFPEPLNSDPFLPPAFSQGEDITPPESDAKIYNLEPISHSQSSMALAARWSSADWRVAGMLSYLQCSLPSAPSDERCARWISSHSLVSIPPWSVSYKSGEEEGAIDAVHLVGAWAGDVVAEEIERVLDCSLVGLVSSIAQPDSAAASTSASPIPYTQAIPPPSPGQSTCYGLALIRAIDATTQSFHILTPLPPSTLSKCRVLIKGEIDLPVWGFLDFGKEPAASASAGEKEKDVKAPYLDWGSSKGIVGAEKRRVRRNVMRKGQM